MSSISDNHPEPLSPTYSHDEISSSTTSSSSTFERDVSLDNLQECFPNIKDYDPKIRDLLDDLNRFSTKINQLEQCFQQENSKFHKTLNESSVQLNKTMKKCGERHVITSRPYYDALKKLDDLKIKCQTAAMKFEKYNQSYLSAKQAILDAELMFHKNLTDDDQFDQFWQEKLNIANSKFNEAKLKREEHEMEHLSMMSQFRVHQYNISQLKTKHKASIRKAKIYFDEASAFDGKLKKIKEDITLLEEELSKCKSLYKKTLRQLEKISEEIHEKRAQLLTPSLKREPGVGAEIDQSTLIEGVSALNLPGDPSDSAQKSLHTSNEI